MAKKQKDAKQPEPDYSWMDEPDDFPGGDDVVHNSGEYAVPSGRTVVGIRKTRKS